MLACFNFEHRCCIDGRAEKAAALRGDDIYEECTVHNSSSLIKSEPVHLLVGHVRAPFIVQNSLHIVVQAYSRSSGSYHDLICLSLRWLHT